MTESSHCLPRLIFLHHQTPMHRLRHRHYFPNAHTLVASSNQTTLIQTYSISKVRSTAYYSIEMVQASESPVDDSTTVRILASTSAFELPCTPSSNAADHNNLSNLKPTPTKLQAKPPSLLQAAPVHHQCSKDTVTLTASSIATKKLTWTQPQTSNH